MHGNCCILFNSMGPFEADAAAAPGMFLGIVSLTFACIVERCNFVNVMIMTKLPMF